ncbi:30S ribosomal protein S20 [Alicyclobacillus sp. SO9]|uniref:30S ribosomal protein S20 n=1 Tax=Alicyclobacillus sp. SO9 TaxID=2665646 RepID=UPI0018E89746|nr:30S ribosomal protein S20 [Alicyclobacillus sp. SO9]QQE77352.1 30S ribosomal protein S20 [Alicyclobacillus sp. SO9]
MPNIKSAEKRVRITTKRNLHQVALRSALRTTLKKFETAVVGNDAEQARLALNIATRALDKAASKGLIHKNKASRKKSRLTRRYNTMAQA